MQAFLIDFTLGGFSGAVAKTLTAPIERIKLVVQTQDANPKIRSGEVPRYKGIVDCGVRIYKEQGMRRFWDGNFTNCIRYFPTQAFNLAFKDSIKKLFPKYSPKTRRRMQMQSEKPAEEHIYKGTFHCFQKIAADEGLAAGLYKGFIANVIRSVGGALVLVLYERSKMYLCL